jgi:hypothetical protein
MENKDYYEILGVQRTATEEEIKHENIVNKESILMMANSKKIWMFDYQSDRDIKRQFIK